MNKTAIKKFAIDARRKLIASVTDKAGMLGITEKGCTNPISQGADFRVYKTVAGTEVTLNRKQSEQRDKLETQINERGFEAIVEEVAYTWFNRICAIRFMEVNDYLPSRVRVLSSEKDGKTEPDIVTQAPDVDLDLTADEKEHIIELKLKSDSKSQDELFRFLFIKQCNKLHEVLPELFEKTSDYTELLLDISYTNKEEIVYKLVNDKDGIAESDFDVTSTDENGEKTGQVEIIGWLYQYYISEKHDQIVNIYKGTVKKEDIPAATQLFTTDWVVRYMVDNSLGRYWIERNPDSKLAEKLQYFVTPKDGHIEYVDEKVDPTELTFFDPCMGSGHILVYAFDVLMEIYRECGYSDRDAALSIVQFNLFGLDIDRRAHQLAYFAVMMKARSYNRRALTQGVFNNVAAIEESNTIEKFECDGITDDREQDRIGEYLVKAFLHAREIGSLQTIEENDYKGFAEYLLNIGKKEVQLNMFSTKWIQNTYPLMLKLTKQATILSKKYRVVCTNPPYMNKLESHLKKFVVDNYKDYSGDLFSVFIYRNFDFCMKNGYSAFMTPFVWMFIKSYEKLREYIIKNKSISTLIQFEYSAFEEATVPICTFVLRNTKEDINGLYVKLSDFKGGMEIQRAKTIEAINDSDCKYFFETSMSNYKRIAGSPIAFWTSEEMLNAFENYPTIAELAPPKQGLATANNDRFLKLWFEVPYEKIGFRQQNCDEANKSTKKWFPYNKGGAFRRWYGNRDYIVNWENDGYEIKHFYDENGKLRSRPQNLGFYFREGITWSDITSASFSGRYSDQGFIFDIKGSSGFPEKDKLFYILGFLNSSVSQKCIKILNPTITTQVGDMARIPVAFDHMKKEIIDRLVRKNIDLVKQDWDSYETSWDFRKSPMIRGYRRIAESYNEWDKECCERFNELKSNEIEINSIFIELYGLQSEMNAEVLDKDVEASCKHTSVTEAIRDFISYAVGCMFGRYSLDREGLICAGSEWNKEQYIMYKADEDNIIPICDEEYFSDDIVARFYEFVEIVFGSECLNENIEFIAKGIGGKGEAKEIIRNYFVSEFYIDHCAKYSVSGSGKRPIYWLFDSGKENGFKALVYIHRYNADTVGRVRTDYLHKEQAYVEAALRSAEYTVDNSSSASEKSKATKAISKYTKQLAEMKIYDEAIAHIANQRIELDLDDGVKVNYEKFQGIEVSREGQKSLKIDLLAKIK